MIEVSHLRKQFGAFTAVDDITFTVNRGEVLGFLGPNGAGKSTSMKMITGFLEPTAGSIKVCGFDVGTQPLDVKKNIGYLPEGAPAYPDMNPVSFLRFIGRVRGYNGAELERRISSAIDKANLRSVAHKSIDTLSKGFKRRVGIAQAIMHDPPVLIMDEPTDGLDPNQKHEMRLLIQEMAKNKAIVVSTHILEEVNAVCTRAIIIAQGRLLFDGTPAQLEAQSRYYNAIRLTAAVTSEDDAARQLRSLDYVGGVDVLGHSEGYTQFMLYAKDGRAIAHPLGQFLRDYNWNVEELSVQPGRLDEVFRAITVHSGAGTRGALT